MSDESATADFENEISRLQETIGKMEDEIFDLKRDLKTVGDDLDDASTERDKLRSALEEIKFTASEAL
jgi:predicted  nucleic acid-binding Zn-ribbon protein